MTGGRVLHHGTLLFQSDLTVLDQITTHHKNDCFRSKGTISAICPVTNIADHLAEPHDAGGVPVPAAESDGARRQPPSDP